MLKIFLHSRFRVGFFRYLGSVDYLELVQSLDQTAVAYLCASLLGVRAIVGLVLGDGVAVLGVLF